LNTEAVHSNEHDENNKDRLQGDATHSTPPRSAQQHTAAPGSTQETDNTGKQQTNTAQYNTQQTVVHSQSPKQHNIA
jgi:hypothetical protein